MDLALYLRVLWRFRVLVLLCLTATFSAAALTVVTVELDGGKPTAKYRQTEIWRSEVTHLLTQEGFPWGRSIYSEVVPLGDESSEGYVNRFADPSRFTSLAVLYAHLAVSDPVLRIMRASGPIRGRFGAEAVRAPDGVSYLPLLRIFAIAPTAEAAADGAKRASSAFQLYLRRNQSANGIQGAERVELPVIASQSRASLESGRSLVVPLFVGVLGIFITIGLVFALENVRPRAVRLADLRDGPKLIHGHTGQP